MRIVNESARVHRKAQAGIQREIQNCALNTPDFLDPAPLVNPQREV
jgi:hypothetical protein